MTVQSIFNPIEETIMFLLLLLLLFCFILFPFFIIFAPNVQVRVVFLRHVFPAHFVRFLFSYLCPFSFIFSTLTRKRRPTLFVVELRHLFYFLIEEDWTMAEKVVRSKNLKKTNQGVDGRFFLFFFFFFCCCCCCFSQTVWEMLSKKQQEIKDSRTTVCIFIWFMTNNFAKY